MDEHVLVDDTGLEVHFGPGGEILALGRDGRRLPLQPGGYGWSLRTSWSDAAPGTLHPCAAVEAVRDSRGGLRVTFDRLRDAAGHERDVHVTLHWQLLQGVLQGRILTACVPGTPAPIALTFPELTLPYSDSARWIVPSDIGLVYEDPAREHAGASTMSGCIRQRAHMQFMAWLTRQGGLYLDCRDPDGWIKAMLLRTGCGSAVLGIEHILPRPVAGPITFPDYPVSLALFSGDWYEAAQLYRPWAMEQAWAARGPEQRRGTYVAELACWLWNRGRSDTVAPPVKEVARRLGLPVALDWYWWHKHPYDTGYPDYFPPREGEAAFKQAVQDLQAHNVAVQVYTNGMSWDQDEPNWETRGRHCTLVTHEGEYFGRVYNTWMNRRLMHTCGASDAWHEQILNAADNAAALGLDGLYIDQVSVLGGQVPCFSSEHGHVPGGGPYGSQGFREMFRGIRSRHPGLVLSSESVSEIYQDLLDCCITLKTSWERCAGAAHSRNVQPIPLFQAVYHGRSVVFGNYSHIDGLTPYDELWPAASRPCAKDERPWQQLCPDQFALDLARTVAFGCQPLTSNLTSAHLADAAFAADIEFFLDLARFYHAHREWLLWGEMLLPGAVHAASIPVTCIKRSIFTPPGSIVPFVVQRPAVLHNAWLAPDGRAGLVLINFTRSPQAIHIERTDGLRPRDRCCERTLAARSAAFIPLD